MDRHGINSKITTLQVFRKGRGENDVIGMSGIAVGTFHPEGGHLKFVPTKKNSYRSVLDSGGNDGFEKVHNLFGGRVGGKVVIRGGLPEDHVAYRPPDEVTGVSVTLKNL